MDLDLSKNYCIICGVDIGDCNPRQLCCKTYCPYDPTDMMPETCQPISDREPFLTTN